MGYRTVAISSGLEKKELAIKLGAHDYIDGSTGDVGEQLQKVRLISCSQLCLPVMYKLTIAFSLVVPVASCSPHPIPT